MSTLLTFAKDVLYHPFCTVWIASVVFLWTKFTFREIDVTKYDFTLESLVRKKELWRIWTSPFLHTSLVELLLNICVIWNLRYVEVNFGSWYMIRYTILLSLANCLLITIAQTILSRAANNPLITEMLYKMQFLGSAGMAMSWISFQSMVVGSQRMEAVFLFFGVISISPSWAPLVLLIFNFMCLSRSGGFNSYAGLLTGVMLGGGLIAILDSPYWQVCLLFDLVVVLLWTLQPPRPAPAGDAAIEGSPEDQALPVRYFRDSHNRSEFLETVEFNTGPSRYPRPESNIELRPLHREPGSATDGGTFSHPEIEDENKDEDSSPLLSSNARSSSNNNLSSSGSASSPSVWNRVWPFQQTDRGSAGAMPMGTSSESNGVRSPRLRSSAQHHRLVNQDDLV